MYTRILIINNLHTCYCMSVLVKHTKMCILIYKRSFFNEPSMWNDYTAANSTVLLQSSIRNCVHHVNVIRTFSTMIINALQFFPSGFYVNVTIWYIIHRSVAFTTTV